MTTNDICIEGYQMVGTILKLDVSWNHGFVRGPALKSRVLQQSPF